VGLKITISFQGIEEVIGNLTRIEEQGQKNLIKLTAELANDTEKAWKAGTPEGKTKRLRGEERAEPSGMSFTLISPTFYYKFVDEGHNTPLGWKTKHGWRPAKRRSHVAGRDMTPKAVEFIRQNIRPYLVRFLD
jgi:hypothetical protein